MTDDHTGPLEAGESQSDQPLTEQEEQFCWEYMNLGGRQGRAGTRAYQRISPTVTPGTARVQASRWLAQPNIQARIAEIQREMTETARVSTEELQARLEAMATSELRDVAEWDGRGVTVKPSSELTPEAAYALEEVEVTPTAYGRKVRVKLADRQRAIRTLLEMRGGLKQVVAHEGEVRWVLEIPRPLSEAEWCERYSPRLPAGATVPRPLTEAEWRAQYTPQQLPAHTTEAD